MTYQEKEALRRELKLKKILCVLKKMAKKVVKPFEHGLPATLYIDLPATFSTEMQIKFYQDFIGAFLIG